MAPISPFEIDRDFETKILFFFMAECVYVPYRVPKEAQKTHVTIVTWVNNNNTVEWLALINNLFEQNLTKSRSVLMNK